MGATNPGWKKEERKVAALFGTTRFPANTGGPIDCESLGFVVQSKFVKAMGLAELERGALEVERVGFQKNPPCIGVFVVKRKRGKARLIVLTEAAWRELNGPVHASVKSEEAP